MIVFKSNVLWGKCLFGVLCQIFAYFRFTPRPRYIDVWPMPNKLEQKTLAMWSHRRNLILLSEALWPLGSVWSRGRISGWYLAHVVNMWTVPLGRHRKDPDQCLGCAGHHLSSAQCNDCACGWQSSCKLLGATAPEQAPEGSRYQVCLSFYVGYILLQRMVT